MNSVGIKIKKLREESGITQTELADFVCCSGQVISNIERGYTKASPDTLAKIAGFFNVPTDYLFGQSNSRWIADSPYLRTNTFSKRIEDRMQHLQMNVSDLAKSADLDEELCKSIVLGNTKPNIDTISKIAFILQTTTDFLVGTSDFAIAVSSEDEQDILKYFRGMDKSRKRRFMGMLEEMINE